MASLKPTGAITIAKVVETKGKNKQIVIEAVNINDAPKEHHFSQQLKTLEGAKEIQKKSGNKNYSSSTSCPSRTTWK